MFRNTSMLRLLLSNSRKFFSQAAMANPDFSWARQRILTTPAEFRPDVVQFDVAGTIVDPYCVAPFLPFKQVFLAGGFHLTEEQILGPMGISKIEHIKHLLNLIENEFITRYLRKPNQNDVNDIYKEFMALLPESVKQRTQLTPGIHAQCGRWIGF